MHHNREHIRHKDDGRDSKGPNDGPTEVVACIIVKMMDAADEMEEREAIMS